MPGVITLTIKVITPFKKQKRCVMTQTSERLRTFSRGAARGNANSVQDSGLSLQYILPPH